MVDGWNVGQWCADHALAPLGITREESFAIPLLWSNAFGFNFDRPEAVDVFDEFERLALRTNAFRGPWRNDDKSASADLRVLGHRHDQTALSVLVHRHRLPTIPCGESFVQSRANATQAAVILAEGM